MTTFPTSRQEIIDHYINLFSYDANAETDYRLSIECADEQTAKLLCKYLLNIEYLNNRLYFKAWSYFLSTHIHVISTTIYLDSVLETISLIDEQYNYYLKEVSLAKTVIKLKANGLERFIPRFGSLKAIRKWLKANSSEAIMSVTDDTDEEATYFVLPTLVPPYQKEKLYHVFRLNHKLDWLVWGTGIVNTLPKTVYSSADGDRLIINYRGSQFNFCEIYLKDISLIIHGKKIV